MGITLAVVDPDVISSFCTLFGYALAGELNVWEKFSLGAQS